MPLQSLKGFEDILPAQSLKWQAVEAIARRTAELYNYGEIRTPVLESSDVYHRGVGETSDMVRKETYTFADRDGDSITMRPEGTAGAARAVIEAGLLNDQGARAKVYYIASNFRHERPQKGRLRQHHQFGIEAYGIAGPEQDAECVLLQLHFYQSCGLRDLALRVNSLGDADSKQRYGEALRTFFSPKAESLSPDSQRRLTENPLRILDSKDPRDIAACEGVPSSVESLSEASRLHFDRFVQLLKSANVTFEVDAKLVRGFDYYTGVLWEVTAGGLGSQNAVGGGGRYDNLVAQLGGRSTPAVGFGSGLERLLIALDAQGVKLPVPERKLVWLAHHGDAARDANLALAAELRSAGVAVDMDLAGRNIKAQFKAADREQARYVLVTGDDELAAGVVNFKDSTTREQTKIARSEIVEKLAAK
ncbi:MAG TPA: histidine--tRNA ligase [Tepidisphaeraceae bacterium]|jgi:histidyl-tRNA synthetase